MNHLICGNLNKIDYSQVLGILGYSQSLTTLLIPTDIDIVGDIDSHSCIMIYVYSDSDLNVTGKMVIGLG